MMSFEDAGKAVPSEEEIIPILIPKLFEEPLANWSDYYAKACKMLGLTDKDIQPYGPVDQTWALGVDPGWMSDWLDGMNVAGSPKFGKLKKKSKKRSKKKSKRSKKKSKRYKKKSKKRSKVRSKKVRL